MMRERDRDILGFIFDYKRDHDGNSPTIREIVAGTDYNSFAGVERSLERLEERGNIKRYGKGRRIMVAGGIWDIPSHAEGFVGENGETVTTYEITRLTDDER